MANSKLQNATGINWKIRMKNPQFLMRTAIGIFLPALAYLGVNYELALQSWAGLLEVLQMLVSSPMALGIIALNVINLIPDPTRSAITDSEIVMDRESPKVPTKIDIAKAQEETPNISQNVSREQVQPPEETNEEQPSEDDYPEAVEDSAFEEVMKEQKQEDEAEDYNDIKFKK